MQRWAFLFPTRVLIAKFIYSSTVDFFINTLNNKDNIKYALLGGQVFLSDRSAFGRSTFYFLFFTEPPRGRAVSYSKKNLRDFLEILCVTLLKI